MENLTLFTNTNQEQLDYKKSTKGVAIGNARCNWERSDIDGDDNEDPSGKMNLCPSIDRGKKKMKWKYSDFDKSNTIQHEDSIDIEEVLKPTPFGKQYS